VSAQFLSEPNNTAHPGGANEHSDPTRREGIVAAAGGVSGFLAAQALAAAPARASHVGAVLLEHTNFSGGPTSISSQTGPETFRATHNGTQLAGAFEPAKTGLLGETASPISGSAGVRGVARDQGRGPGGAGTTYGVRGVSLSPNGKGVIGEADFSGGAAVGVEGNSASGTGVLGHGGNIGVWGTSSDPTGVGVLADNPGGGIAFRARGAARITDNLKVGPSNANPAFQVDASSFAPGQTAILVRRNVGGTFSTQRVSMGGPNSGGAGFRMLRVPN
jgi:hypothetical protein